MKIVSTQVSPILRAYTEQLRTEYARAGREGRFHPAPARGFETVTLSDEARALAARSAEVTDPEESEEPEETSQASRSEESLEADEPSPRLPPDPSRDPI